MLCISVNPREAVWIPSVGPDLGPNCLQRLSTEHETAKVFVLLLLKILFGGKRCQMPSYWPNFKLGTCIPLSTCTYLNFRESIFSFLNLHQQSGKLFAACFLSSADFFSNFFVKFFQAYHQSVNQFGSRPPDILSGRIWVQTVCKRLLADDTTRLRVEVF